MSVSSSTRIARSSAAFVAVAMALLAPPASSAGFTALGYPGCQLVAMSQDGQVAVGGLVGNATGGFRWSAAHGVQPLDSAMSVQGVSASGRYVAGSSLDADQREVASYWNADGRLVRLGGLPDTKWQSGIVSVAFGISDEPRIVGMANSPDQQAAAFEWTMKSGMHVLPQPADAKAARASGVSEDGHRIDGWIELQPGQRRGVLWNDGVLQVLPSSADIEAGEVLGANRDITLLLGVGLMHRNADVAYRWSEQSGPQRLPILAASSASPLHLLAGSDSGRVLVGSAGIGASRVAMAWTAQGGLQPIVVLLAARGIAVPAGWTLAAATGISGDGHRIGGWGQHDGHIDSFVVELPDAANSPAISASSSSAAATR